MVRRKDAGAASDGAQVAMPLPLENGELAATFLGELWTSAKLDGVLETFFADDAVDHSSLSGQGRNIGALRDSVNAIKRAFPNLEFTLADQIAQGDTVSTRFALHGKQMGKFMDIDPTCAEVSIRGFDITRCKDGRIVEHWLRLDYLDLAHQLGAVRTPVQARAALGLGQEITGLVDKIERRQMDTRGFVRFAIALILGAPLSWLVVHAFGQLFNKPAIDLYGVIIAVLLCLLGIALLAMAEVNHWATHDLQVQLQRKEDDLDLVTTYSVEQRAERLFKLHQFELKRYYDQALRQSSGIFATGIACIVFGFAIIGVSLYFVVAAGNTSTNSSHQIIVSLFGVVSGILSNFIGVLYLRMYSGTIQSLTEFHNRLVTTNHLHFGNFLAAKIADIGLRETTIAQIAQEVSKMTSYVEVSAAAASAPVDASKKDRAPGSV